MLKEGNASLRMERSLKFVICGNKIPLNFATNANCPSTFSYFIFTEIFSINGLHFTIKSKIFTV